MADTSKKADQFDDSLERPIGSEDEACTSFTGESLQDNTTGQNQVPTVADDVELSLSESEEIVSIRRGVSKILSDSEPEISEDEGSSSEDVTADKDGSIQVCGECNREDRMLLCDACDHGYHMECLQPPLEHMGRCYCPECGPLHRRLDTTEAEIVRLLEPMQALGVLLERARNIQTQNMMPEQRLPIGPEDEACTSFTGESLQDNTTGQNQVPTIADDVELSLSKSEEIVSIMRGVSKILSDSEPEISEDEGSSSEDVTADEDGSIQVCGECNREDRMLLCDACDHGYHMECLQPPLEHIPMGRCYCPECSPLHRILDTTKEAAVDRLFERMQALRALQERARNIQTQTMMPEQRLPIGPEDEACTSFTGESLQDNTTGQNQVPTIADDVELSLSESEEIVSIRRGVSKILSDSEPEISEDEGSSSEGVTADKDGSIQACDSSSDSDGQSEKCVICLAKLGVQQIGSPESCDHVFCLVCLLKWAKNMNTCPVDRQPFTLILVRESLDGNVINRIPIEAPVQTEEAPADLTYCEVCGECNRGDRMLLCDACGHGYHMECLQPPLEHIPMDRWYCPECGPLHRIRTTTCGGDELNQRTLLHERVRAQHERLRIIQTHNMMLKQILNDFEKYVLSPT